MTSPRRNASSSRFAFLAVSSGPAGSAGSTQQGPAHAVAQAPAQPPAEGGWNFEEEEEEAPDLG